MSIQYAGGTNVNTTFTSDATKATLQTNIAAALITAGWSIATGVVPSTVTISVAAPGVVSWGAAHGLLVNDQVSFTTTGALPTGLTAGTVYYVKTILSGTTASLSTTPGGGAITTSGSQSGVHTALATVRMATAATAWGVTARVKMQDNAGTCLVFSLESSNSSVAGTSNTANGGQLKPVNLRTFRIIANKYQAFIFSAAVTPSMAFVAFGTPYVPTFLQGSTTECGWLQSNCVVDGNATIVPSLRTNVKCGAGFGAYSGAFQGISNSNLIDYCNNNNPGQCGVLTILLPNLPNSPSSGGGLSGASGQSGTHWADGSAIMLEPLLQWASSSISAEPLLRGQLWDAAVVMDTFAGDTTTAFDSHNWWGLTDSNGTDKATVFLVVP